MSSPVMSSPGTSSPAVSSDTLVEASARDRYIDFLRVTSIVIVVMAHWVLALVVLDGDVSLGRSRLAQLITWALMVMPVCFVVGGFGHARTLGSVSRRAGYTAFVTSRADRLLRPVGVMLAAWLGAAVVLGAAGAGARPVALALDRIPTPLWFIAIYLVIVVMAPAMHVLHRRLGLPAMVPLVGVVAALDCLRYLGDVAWAGPLNTVAVWLTLHQFGFALADGTLTRRGALMMAVAGLGTAALLTLVTGWYPVDMQGLPGSDAANFAPPNLALLAHGVGLVGVLLVGRGPVTRWLQRPRPWAAVMAVGSVIMTVFCWHLTAVFAVQGLLLLSGIAMPGTTTASWWLLLPGWLVLCALPLAVLVVGFRRFERAPTRTHRPHDDRPPGRITAASGVLLSAVGIYVVSQVGLDGLATGTPDPVFGRHVPAWPGLLLLALGLGVRQVTAVTQVSGSAGQSVVPFTGCK